MIGELSNHMLHIAIENLGLTNQNVALLSVKRIPRKVVETVQLYIVQPLIVQWILCPCEYFLVL